MLVLPFNRTESQAAASYALFGKLPNRPDFVRINANHPAAIEFDDLIQRSFERWSAVPDWESGYEALEPVDFQYLSRDQRHVLVGVLKPSRDQAGRRYPMVAAAILPSESIDTYGAVSPIAYEVFYDGLREQVGNAIDNSVEALSCRQFLEDQLRNQESAAADLELAESVVGRFMTTQGAGRLNDLLVAAEPPATLQQALLNIVFYLAHLRRFDHPATNQIVVLPLSGNKGEQALVASSWLSLLSALGWVKGSHNLWRGSYLFLRQPEGSSQLVVSLGRMPDGFFGALLGGVFDPRLVLDLAEPQEAWKSHRLYAEVSYALGRLLADPACRLAELQDFLKGVGQQLDEVN